MIVLTKRQQRILRILVQEHIAAARPVGSRTIADGYELGISSATIRNELAELEEQGYLTHPHTSAGRIPTETGYRYFVECLMEEAELPLIEERMIRHQFHQASMELEQWMKLAASVLARTAQSAALVAPPHSRRSRFRRLELVLLHEGLILAILILERGIVRQRLTSAPEGSLSQEDLVRVANRFNATLIGLEGRGLAANILRPSSLEKLVLDHVSSMMEEVDTQSASELYQDGLLNVLRQPELAGMGKVEQTIRILEEGQVITTILAQGLGRAGVQVIIGGEGRWEEMSDFSLVMSRYGSVGRAVGVMGVLGPLRMPYGRAISAVRYVAGLMSDLVGTIYSD